MKKEHIKTIFLDYDGTLHDSLAIYKPAFLEAFHMLVEEGYMNNKEFKDEEISQYLGQSTKEMWDKFGKGLPEEIKQKGSKKIGETMEKLIQSKKATLYDGSLDVLAYLKEQGYKLVFISNCTNRYMHNHTKMFSLNHFFDEMVNAEMYNHAPKEVILSKIKDNFPNEMVIVGDRHHDMRAGKENGIYTIACTYGFGEKSELKDADIMIADIKELKKIL